MSLADEPAAYIDTPAGATWTGPRENGQRVFNGHEWAVAHTTYDGHYDEITVGIIGTQHADGRIQRRIVLDCLIDPVITADEARRLIAVLTAAVAPADNGLGN
jgi:hypothetical protein